MISDIEVYFKDGCGRCARFATPDCSARLWTEGVLALRHLCCEAGLDEAVKWGHPCYALAGRNIALIGALRADFRLSFFNAALLRDPEAILQRSGPNSRNADTVRFTDAAQVAARAPILRAYLAEAMAHARAGTKPPKDSPAPDLPDTLIEALDADPDLAEAFHRLTPGRQRSYGIALSSAKTEATQIARIARFRPAILAGKGANER